MTIKTKTKQAPPKIDINFDTEELTTIIEVLDASVTKLQGIGFQDKFTGKIFKPYDKLDHMFYTLVNKTHEAREIISGRKQPKPIEFGCFQCHGRAYPKKLPPGKPFKDDTCYGWHLDKDHTVIHFLCDSCIKQWRADRKKEENPWR